MREVVKILKTKKMKPIISNNVKYWQKEYRGDIRKIESNFFGKNNFSTEFKRFYLVLKGKKNST